MPEPESQLSLLLVSADLMLGGMANGHARAAGFEVIRCLSMAKATERLSEKPYSAVVVELGLDGLDPVALKESSGEAIVIGFAGHVRDDLLGAAQNAGLQVLTNGQMHGQGESILRNLRDRLAAGRSSDDAPSSVG